MPPRRAYKSLQVLRYDYTYLDSGAPPSTRYTTWVILHGLGFNAAVFEKLFPLSHTHNIRIVAVNRRGYPPSSGFREDELKVIGQGRKFDEAEPFYHAQGIEIATFLVNFATEQRIPSAHPSGSAGGIVLIGWSLGAVHALTVLAFTNELQDDTRSTLRKYLHTVLLHDPMAPALGVPCPERSDFSLFFEPDDNKRFNEYIHRMAGHFTHLSVTSGDIDDLEFNHPSNRPHTLRELCYERRLEYTHLDPFRFGGCDMRLVMCDTSAYAEIVRRAMFDWARAKMFPDVRVRVMSGGESGGMMIWPTWVLRKYLDHPKKLYGPEAERARDVKVVNHAEGNHFVAWQDPQKAIEHYSAAIKL